MGLAFLKLLLTALISLQVVQVSAKLTEPIGKSVAEPVPELQGVGIDQKIGSDLPLDLEFKNENGQVVKLGQFLAPGKPVILSPVYYGCRSLCNYHLNGLTEGLKGLDWNPGDKYEVLAISFDDHEGPELAKGKKASYMKLYNRPQGEAGWHFLTGDTNSIKALTSAVGFKFRWNQAMNEWAHPSAAIVISPKGKITRYLPGVFFRPQDIKLALNESVDGKLGTFVDRMVLFCFRYDEHQSKYSPFVSNIMKLGGGLMILALAIWLLPFWIRSRRRLT
jgi:protein SCO1/2